MASAHYLSQVQITGATSTDDRLLFAASRVVIHRLFNGRRVLHFTPERQAGHVIEQLASQYVTADFLDPACDLRLNMSRKDALGEN